MPVKFSRTPPNSIASYINRQFRIKASISLYRKILRLTQQMTHYDENGVLWRDIIRYSCRKEFNDSKDEKDEEILARALFNAQSAFDDFETKFLQKQKMLEERQKEAENVVLGKSKSMNRDIAEKILRGEDVEQRLKLMEKNKSTSSPSNNKSPNNGIIFDAYGNEIG